VGVHVTGTGAHARGDRGQSRAIRRYVPGHDGGAVTLFRAEEQPTVRPDLGWSALLPQLEIEVVPGDHHTCVTRHVKAFASRLGARLQQLVQTRPLRPVEVC